MHQQQHTPFFLSHASPLDSNSTSSTMFASPAQFDPYAFAHIATGSPAPSTASSSSSSASPSLFDLPSPQSMPISTPSPSSSSSLALPFYSDSHTGRSSSYDSHMGDFALPQTASTGGMTINPSLLFGADFCAPAPTDSFLSSSAPSSSSSSHPFFPSSSPPQPLPPPLFGESTTPQQRRAQVAALSSLVVVKPAPSSAGPVKRGKGGAARTRSLSQGRATAAPRGRRASANDSTDDGGAKSAKSWLDALKEAEIKAKLRRLQTQAQFDGPPTPGSGGRMAQLQSQLLAQSMAPQTGPGIVAQCEASTAMLGGAAFPWVR